MVSSTRLGRFALLLALCAAVLSLVAFVRPPQALSANQPVTGWAWSSNVGWICFGDATYCPAASVGMDSSGNILGYAWNSNIGWIQFGGLSDFPSYQEDRTIYLTSGTSWVVPADWNSSHNTIEVIGGGAGASTGAISGGGGGGAYSKISNLALTPGATVTYRVGSGGAVGTNGGDTMFNRTSGTSNNCGTYPNVMSVCAKAGLTNSGLTGGQGGSAGLGIGTVKYSGGKGGNGISNSGSGGGGGAAGPLGAGGTGGTGSSAATYTSGGGGGSDGGSVGEDGVSDSNGGGGGDNAAGTGHGSGAMSFADATNGTAGGGGGGGYNSGTRANGGNGGAGTEWDATHGSGGGGGGAVGASGVAGNGGLYGGGGGGRNGGTGGQGIIVITYAPLSVPAGGNAKIVDNALAGWARALSADGNGWNGWVYLGDTGNGDGVTVDLNGNFLGYAWGGNVLGWISFCSIYGCVHVEPPCAASAGNVCSDSTTVSTTDPWCKVTTTACDAAQICSAGSCVTAKPEGTLTISPSRVRKNSTVQISWSVTNAQSCSVSGAYTGGTLGPYTASPSTSGPVLVPTVFTLSCVGADTNAYTVDSKRVDIVPSYQEI